MHGGVHTNDDIDAKDNVYVDVNVDVDAEEGGASVDVEVDVDVDVTVNCGVDVNFDVDVDVEEGGVASSCALILKCEQLLNSLFLFKLSS